MTLVPASKDPSFRLSDDAFQGLSALQFAYCQARMAGANMAQAYIAVYQPKEGSANTIGQRAYQVEHNPKVQAKLRELITGQVPATSLPAITKDFVLTGIATLAVSAEKQTTQLRAFELLGKSLGLFDRENYTDPGDKPLDSSTDVDAELKRMLKAVLAPEIEGTARRVEPAPYAGKPAAGGRGDRRRKPAT